MNDQENKHREIELTWRIAKELSDIIVYCRAVTFNQERILRDGRNPHEMSSFSEQKAEKLMLQEYVFFLWYHQVGHMLQNLKTVYGLNQMLFLKFYRLC